MLYNIVDNNALCFRKRRALRSPQAPIPVVLDLDAEETPRKGHFTILNVSILCLFAFMCSLFNHVMFFSNDR